MLLHSPQDQREYHRFCSIRCVEQGVSHFHVMVISLLLTGAAVSEASLLPLLPTHLWSHAHNLAKSIHYLTRNKFEHNHEDLGGREQLCPCSSSVKIENLWNVKCEKVCIESVLSDATRPRSSAIWLRYIPLPPLCVCAMKLSVTYLFSGLLHLRMYLSAWGKHLRSAYIFCGHIGSHFSGSVFWFNFRRVVFCMEIWFSLSMCFHYSTSFVVGRAR